MVEAFVNIARVLDFLFVSLDTVVQSLRSADQIFFDGAH